MADPAPDPLDYSDKFNTKLSADDETKFEEWQKSNPRLGNTYDYDARGFWKDGAKTADNGHGSDAYKKPNHPTFSDQSQYSTSANGTGGQWSKDDSGHDVFTPSDHNLSLRSVDKLRDVLKTEDHDVIVNAPQTKADKRYAKK
jgi:hypothetical protein